MGDMMTLEKAILGLETKLAYGLVKLDTSREIRIVLDELVRLRNKQRGVSDD